jgi:hypothetical protein
VGREVAVPRSEAERNPWEPERPYIRGTQAAAAHNAPVEEETEDRFTELARTRLADTLSEAARMLSGPPPDDPPPRRAAGRGFDETLLARPATAALGLVRPLTPPASPDPDAEVDELRAEVDRLRAEVEAARRRVEAAEARAEKHEAALRDLRGALDHLGHPARAPVLQELTAGAGDEPEPTRPVALSEVAPSKVAPMKPDPVEQPQPQAPDFHKATSGFGPCGPNTVSPGDSQPDPLHNAAPGCYSPGPPGTSSDDAGNGYTWAFAEQPPRRRFWRGW